MRYPDFAVIGDPIAHSLSPAIHQAAYQVSGLDLTYQAIRVESVHLEKLLDELVQNGVRGINVTVPHKEAVRDWCSSIDGYDYGAVNTIDLRTRRGTNTDAPAFLHTLRHAEIHPPGPILVLGAGGTARTVILALHSAGYEVVTWNRTASRLQELRVAIGPIFRAISEPAFPQARAVINATSVSITGTSLKIDWSEMSRKALAYDLGYAPEPTPFLVAAAEHGLPTLDGKLMLVEQAALAFEWWFGIPAPRAAMLNAIGV